MAVRVQVLDEKGLPVFCNVAAVRTSDQSILSQTETNSEGVAVISESGTWYPRPMVSLDYKSRIRMIILNDQNSICYDYVVNCEGGGTHDNLDDAWAAAVAAGGNKTIWLCCDAELSAPLNLSGMDDSAIAIHGAMAHGIDTTTVIQSSRVTITAAANQPIFLADGGTNGDNQINLRNVGISTSIGYAIIRFDGTNGNLDTFELDGCTFSATNVMEATGIANIITVCRIREGSGSIVTAVFNRTSGAGSGPDVIEVTNSRSLSIGQLWNGTENAERVILEGGAVSLGSTDFSGGQYYEVRNITITTGSVVFTSSSSSQNTRRITLQGITVRASGTGAALCNLQSAAINNGRDIFIHGNHGVINTGITPSGVFITLDSDYTAPFVADNHAPDWAGGTYSGPSGVGDDHGNLTGLTDDDHTQYVLRSILTTNGDLYTRAAGVIARLGVGGANTLLGVSAGLPAWQVQSYLDHGSISGLTDDDHTQYVLRSILTTNGDIFIRSGGAIARLGIGTEGQVLTTSGGAPVWADATGGSGGGGGGGIITMLADVGGNIWNDQPAALTELFGLTNHRLKIDLTNASDARLTAKINSAGASGAELRAQYSLDESSWDYLDGSSGPKVRIDVTGVEISTPVAIVGTATDDVFIRLVGIGGDGGVDPEIGLVTLQVDALGSSGGAPTDYAYLGFGSDATLSAEQDVYGFTFQNEVMNWPALENADNLQPFWWQESAGTVTLTDVDVAGEGITESFERALKVVTSANDVYAYQRYTYADQPRIKSGRTLSAAVWVWSVSSAVAQVKLITSAASSVSSATTIAAGWTLLKAEGLVLDGTYVDLVLEVDTGTAYFADPTVLLGPKGLVLGPRGLRRRRNDGNTLIKTYTGIGDEATWTDIDCTSASSPLAVWAGIRIAVFENTAADSFTWYYRINGRSTTNDGTTEAYNDGAGTTPIVPNVEQAVLLDENQIFEYFLDRTAGSGTLDFGTGRLSWWEEWE